MKKATRGVPKVPCSKRQKPHVTLVNTPLICRGNQAESAQNQLLALRFHWALLNTLKPSVMCDESGHTKFPFSCLAHVTLLTLAQARLSPCSGFAQAGSRLLTLITIFGTLRSLPNHFNSSRGGLELVPYVKIAKMCPESG